MKQEPKCFFSIIVPVYKVEEYLEACVESVLRQTFTDFELILVDDGSPDRSGEICDELARKDSRIRVLHQKNGGASSARNHGLRHACGDYVLFLDSDDFYPQENFLERIYGRCGDSELVCFNYARYTDRLLPLLIDYPEEDGVQTDVLLRELVKRNAFTSSACLKAVRRSVLTENSIEFEEGISGEDIEWNAKVMAVVKQIRLAPDCIYAYRVRQESVTHTMTPKQVDMLLRILGKLMAASPKGSEAFLEAYRGYIAFQYCTILINARICRPRLSAEQMREIRELSWLLQYDVNRIVKLIRTVYRLLGFEITSWLLVIYFKLFCK